MKLRLTTRMTPFLAIAAFLAIGFLLANSNTPAEAKPEYAGPTGQGCDVCHALPSYSRTAIGQQFEAISTHETDPAGAWAQITAPTSTPVPPTSTSVPPTSTAVPPTATPTVVAPPTTAPPTATPSPDWDDDDEDEEEWDDEDHEEWGRGDRDEDHGRKWSKGEEKKKKSARKGARSRWGGHEADD